MNPLTGEDSVAERADETPPREQRHWGSPRGMPLEAHRGEEGALRGLGAPCPPANLPRLPYGDHKPFSHSVISSFICSLSANAPGLGVCQALYQMLGPSDSSAT